MKTERKEKKKDTSNLYRQYLEHWFRSKSRGCHWWLKKMMIF